MYEVSAHAAKGKKKLEAEQIGDKITQKKNRGILSFFIYLSSRRSLRVEGGKEEVFLTYILLFVPSTHITCMQHIFISSLSRAAAATRFWAPTRLSVKSDKRTRARRKTLYFISKMISEARRCEMKMKTWISLALIITLEGCLMLRESENVDSACFVINCFVIFAAFGCLWCDEVVGMGVRRLVDL